VPSPRLAVPSRLLSIATLLTGCFQVPTRAPGLLHRNLIQEAKGRNNRVLSTIPTRYCFALLLSALPQASALIDHHCTADIASLGLLQDASRTSRRQGQDTGRKEGCRLHGQSLHLASAVSRPRTQIAAYCAATLFSRLASSCRSRSAQPSAREAGQPSISTAAHHRALHLLLPGLISTRLSVTVVCMSSWKVAIHLFLFPGRY
jgi:hypothetical protein